MKLLVGLILIAFLFHQVNQRDSIIEELQQSNLWHIALCLALLVLNIALSWGKWFFLLRRRFPDVTGNQAFGSLMFGYTMGLVTPGRLGELARGLFFEKYDKVVVTGINILDKVISQVVTVTLGCIALGAYAASSSVLSPQQFSSLFVIGGLFLLFFWSALFHPSFIARTLGRLSRKSGDVPANLAGAIGHLNAGDVLVASAIAVAWFLVIALQYHVLVLAFTPVSIWVSMQAVFAILFVKTLIPLTFGDLGIRESVSILFYGALGISEAAVFNAALLIFLINFLIPALWGSYYLFRIHSSGQALNLSLIGKSAAAERQPGESPVP